MSSKTPKGSLTRQFSKSLLWLYFISILISLPLTYFWVRNQVYSQAQNELTLLVDMVRSVRNVVREDTRPHFLPKGEFFPPVVSSTVMAKTVASKFAREQPDYYIKIASDNPLNQENLPQPLEKELLSFFRQTNTTDPVVQTGIVKDKEYLVSAAPATAKESCMICHGNPSEAPAEITETYGVNSGFGWKAGSVVGASLVGVPLGDVNSIVLKRGLIIISILTVLFGLVLIVVNYLVRRVIIQPVLEITSTAKDVSHGQLDQSFDSNNNNEIGELAQSFELMRRSLLMAMKRLKGE